MKTRGQYFVASDKEMCALEEMETSFKIKEMCKSPRQNKTFSTKYYHPFLLNSVKLENVNAKNESIKVISRRIKRHNCLAKQSKEKYLRLLAKRYLSLR